MFKKPDIDHPAIGNFVEAGGLHTNYHEMGAGPPVICLHGSGAGVTGYENWHGIMPALAQDYRVLAPDIVGFGFTQRPDSESYNIKVWTRHVLDFMDAMGIDKASFVGNSFGGALALALALRNAHRVDKLILMGTPAGEFTRPAMNRGSSWNYEPSEESMAQVLRAFPYDPAHVTHEMVRQRHQVTVHAGGMAAYRKLFPEPKGEGPQTVRGIPEVSLHSIQNSTLVVHGRQDSMVPLVCGERIAANVPNSDLHVFGKCGHWVQIERKQAFIDLTRHFLRSDF